MDLNDGIRCVKRDQGGERNVLLENLSLTTPNPNHKKLYTMICGHAEVLHLPAKKVFLEPGMPMDGIYYIIDGRTRHYMMNSSGVEKILYMLTTGWFYGLTACDLQRPTGLYSSTEVDSTLFRIPMEEYRELLNIPLFRDAILECQARKTTIMRYEIENLTYNSCKDRLKFLLCATADQHCTVDGKWYKTNMNYTQYEISTIIGASRVTISKLLSELCDEGFVRTLNRRIEINISCCKAFLKEKN